MNMFKKGIGRISIIIVMNLTFVTFLVLTTLKGYSSDYAISQGAVFTIEQSSNSAHFSIHFEHQNLNAVECEVLDVEEEKLERKKANSSTYFQEFLSQINSSEHASGLPNLTGFERPFLGGLYYIKYCALKILST